MGKKILPSIIGLTGLGLTGLALLAQKLGLARSNAWGFGRQLLLGAGLACLLVFGLILTYGFWKKALQAFGKAARSTAEAWQGLPGVQKVTSAFRTGLKAAKSGWDRLPPVRWFRSTLLVRYFADSQDRLAALAAACLGILVVTIYIFYVSVGRWTDWPKNTNYYDQLAQAFSHGQPYLLQKPDPALAGLSDPYDFNIRGSIHVLWDASYYDGKYFLNWGPAPALVLMVVHLFTSQPIGDEVLVFSFVTGAFLFSSLLILGLRKRLFPNLNWKYVIPAILVAGFANPLPWILNRPAVYEAAVAGGQFFLLAGLFFAFTAIAQQPPVYWKLVLASLCWVLAMASRSTLTLAVSFLIPAFGLYLVPHVERRQALKYVLTMGLILCAGLAGMLWYNKIRFNSWFEFGLRYLMTGVNFYKYYSEAWALDNFLPNFNNYLINPFRTLSIFPYVKPDWGGRLLFFYYKAPAHYSGEQVSGLIPTLPFIFLALIPLVDMLRAGWRMFGPGSAARHLSGPRIVLEIKEWTFLTLGGACLLAFLPILFYISNNMRYLADMVPMTVLLSILGFWQGVEALARRPGLRGMFILLVILLVTYSVMVSLLLAMTGNEARFEKLNPALFDNLTHWLTP